jgi:hypothetical protein
MKIQPASENIIGSVWDFQAHFTYPAVTAHAHATVTWPIAETAKQSMSP